MKRERRREKGRRKDIEKEGEIRERARERCKGYIERAKEGTVPLPFSRNRADRCICNLGEAPLKEKLSGEIMTRNYELVYYVAQNVGIIGILAFPKIRLPFL